MANNFVQVPPDSTGKKVDTAEVVIAGQTVERQRIVVADPSGTNPDVRPTATGAVPVDGSAVTQPVSGTVAVSNLPGTQPVSGTVAVSNFPATQPVSGTVAVSTLPALPAGTNVIGHVIVDSAGSVSVTALPSIPAGSNVIGHVIVDSLSGTVSISGTVSVSNFPATQPVSGTVTANIGTTNGLALDATVSSTQPRDVTDRSARLLGHVTVDSAPTTAVTGTFFQTTQPVSAAALPLPANAAQETGGNLATMTTLLYFQDKIIDLLERIAGILEAEHLVSVANSNMGGASTDDVIVSIQ